MPQKLAGLRTTENNAILGLLAMEVRMQMLEGMRFGKLVVLRRERGGVWMCQCDCGRISYPTTSNLRGANTQSCGCVRDQKRTKHGLVNTPEYKVWKGMRSRCHGATDGQYRNYGARGLTVAPEWNDFAVFLRDMGQRPSPKHQLDRIDNEKGYSKENCRWATAQQNHNNTRSNRLIEYQGATKTIAEWADELGIIYPTLRNRLNRGWPVERALTEPVSRVRSI
jgi:hypothetical protein